MYVHYVKYQVKLKSIKYVHYVKYQAVNSENNRNNLYKMFRVREIISNGDIKRKLLPLIPKDEKTCKEELKDVKAYYPSTFIKILPGKYSDFGLITEYMLRFSLDEISNDILKLVTEEISNVEIPETILNLMSTKRYLENIKNTRRVLDNLLDEDEELMYDEEISYDIIEGHPDIITNKRIFEVKTSCKPVTDWNDYLLQIFSYAALSMINSHSQNIIHIVLPLQEVIWSFDVREWNKHEKFIEILSSFSPPSEDDVMFGQMLCCENNIGATISKEKGSIINTLIKLSESKRPFQFFLNGNLSSSVCIPDIELDEAYAFLLSNPHLKVFCHLPYTITLSNMVDEEDEFTQRSLMQYLTCVTRIGLMGGVVHVGKSNKYPVNQAIENMRQNIINALEYATEESPLLLETPSGQGKELLTTFDDFMEFMDSIPDPRLGICMDTCHVFATGQLPGEFLAKMMSNERWISRLKLIHFNDSKKEFGSCVDRHAPIGCGKIPKEEFLQVVSIASIYQIPMVIE